MNEINQAFSQLPMFLLCILKKLGNRSTYAKIISITYFQKSYKNQIDDFNCFNENQQNIASFFYIPVFSGLFDPICTDAFFFHFNFQKLVKSHHAKIIFKNIVKLKVLQFEV